MFIEEDSCSPVCPRIQISFYCRKVKCAQFVQQTLFYSPFRFLAALSIPPQVHCLLTITYLNSKSVFFPWEHNLNEHGLTQCQGSFVPRILVDNELRGDSSKRCQFSPKKGVNDGRVGEESLSSLIPPWESKRLQVAEHMSRWSNCHDPKMRGSMTNWSERNKRILFNFFR